MALAGLSTLGVTFGYGVEATAGTKPTSFTKLTRINSIGGISADPDVIDASALEDLIQKNIAGRTSITDSIAIDVNLTAETQTEWEGVISAYNALSGGKQMWFEVIVEGMTDAFFFIAQPPQILPMSDMGQNELLIMTINLVVADYKGLDTKVAFS